mgnify:CR=1 FL=1
MYQVLNEKEITNLFSSFHQELKENAELYVKNFCQSRSDVSKKDQNNLVEVIYDLLIASHLFNRNKMKTFSIYIFLFILNFKVSQLLQLSILFE